MRHAARRDANEGDIVEALAKVGACVLRVSSPGAPDLLLLYRGRYFALEVKARNGRLTPAQERIRAMMAYPIVRTVDDALRVIGVLYSPKSLTRVLKCTALALERQLAEPRRRSSD